MYHNDDNILLSKGKETKCFYYFNLSLMGLR